MKNVLLIAGLLMVGCNDGKDSGDTDTGDTTTGEVTPSASVSWGSDSLTVTLTDGDDITFFGITETGGGCTDCWTGEDCDGGYELSTGDLLQYCHPVSGGSITLGYDGDPNSLSEGSETVFNAGFEGSVTYYIEDSSANCYVWGDNPGYYAGCTEI